MTVHINGYEIDVFTDEVHTFDSLITSDPVEEGSDTTDNIKPLSDVVTLTGIVSNTPFGLIEDSRSEGEVVSQTALDFLKAVRDLREPVTIETSLGIYTNMGMERLTIPQNVNTGDALQFTATFKQLRIVTTDRQIVRVEVPRARRKSKRGAVANKGFVGASARAEDNPKLTVPTSWAKDLF